VEAKVEAEVDLFALLHLRGQSVGWSVVAHSSEVVIWLISGIQVVFSTLFFVFSYFSVERIVFYFDIST